MQVRDVTGYAASYPFSAENSVTVGVGRAVKRDAVVVKVTTEFELVGYGESHHSRGHSSIAHFINTSLRRFVLGMEATDAVGIWSRLYRGQLSGMGLGAACAMAKSGIDMALWDIRGKSLGCSLYRLLGSRRAIPAYAGGVALEWQELALADEAVRHVAAGYKVGKLWLGDNVERDQALVKAVRRAVGDRIFVSKNNLFRDAQVSNPFSLDEDGSALPLDVPGIGVDVDEEFLLAHPAIEGPAYV
jgi:D-galactarolactone cycloisomerase